MTIRRQVADMHAFLNLRSHIFSMQDTDFFKRLQIFSMQDTYFQFHDVKPAIFVLVP